MIEAGLSALDAIYDDLDHADAALRAAAKRAGRSKEAAP